jgi:glucose-1-phosphate thymidylyltransferase
MKGIILAGGTGTRLFPATKAVSKQLLPLYDKPMIYYPLSVLMLMGIKEVLIITRESEKILFQQILGDGLKYGMHFYYEVQSKPNGIAEAFLIGKDFVGQDRVCLILGDNVFYGQGLTDSLLKASSNTYNAVIFGTKVKNPGEFGVAEINNGEIVALVEKPSSPKSSIAVPGIYIYPNDVVEKVKSLSKSNRGELEITDLNNIYLSENRLEISLMGRGIAWLDTGTPRMMLMASEFISVIQERQKNYVACIEEIAYRRGFISLGELKRLGEELSSSDYGKYILEIVEEQI